MWGTERETREEQQSPSCCSSSVRAKVLIVLQLCAKLLLFLANILYLALLFTVGMSIYLIQTAHLVFSFT